MRALDVDQTVSQQTEVIVPFAALMCADRRSKLVHAGPTQELLRRVGYNTKAY